MVPLKNLLTNGFLPRGLPNILDDCICRVGKGRRAMEGPQSLERLGAPASKTVL